MTINSTCLKSPSLKSASLQTGASGSKLMMILGFVCVAAVAAGAGIYSFLNILDEPQNASISPAPAKATSAASEASTSTSSNTNFTSTAATSTGESTSNATPESSTTTAHLSATEDESTATHESSGEAIGSDSAAAELTGVVSGSATSASTGGSSLPVPTEDAALPTAADYVPADLPADYVAPEAVSVNVSGDSISFAPIRDAKSIQFGFAGGDDSVYIEPDVLNNGGSLSLSSVSSGGDLTDGEYNWEITAQPADFNYELFNRISGQGDAPDPKLERKMLSELRKKTRVERGRFRVKDGVITSITDDAVADLDAEDKDERTN